jgi:hypothetical protein
MLSDKDIFSTYFCRHVESNLKNLEEILRSYNML